MRRRLMAICRDHSRAPAYLTCLHLIDGKRFDFVECRAPDRLDSDFFCGACAANYPMIQEDQVQAVCMHCMRAIKKRAEIKRRRIMR
jgi:hypothetical protein